MSAPFAGETCERWGELKIRRFKKAHAEGLADWQLAERFGVTVLAIAKQRERWGLNAHQDPWAAV